MPQFADDAGEVLTDRGEAVIDSPRPFGIGGPGDHASCLQVAEPLDEGFGAHVRQGRSELAVPSRAGQELSNDEHGPFAVQGADGGLDRALPTAARTVGVS